MSGRINYSNLSDSLKAKFNGMTISKGGNTLYTAENCMKTFESENDGYIDNFYLEGKTLINISTLGSIDGTNADGVVRIRFYDENIIDDSFIHYKRFSGKTFTCYNFTEANIHYVCRNSADEWAYSFVVEPYSSEVVEISNDLAIVGVDFTPEDGWSNADLSIYNERMFMVLEGEQSPNQPYFKGICDVGRSFRGKHYIEVMTYNKNLFNKEDFVVGSTASTLGNEFIIDNKTTRITHKNPIPLEYLRNHQLRYREHDIKVILYQLDENRNILSVHEWGKYNHVRLNIPGAKYIQFIFAYDDNREMSLDDFDVINPILAEECDICEFESRLLSLPNGVKDTVEKKGGEYIHNSVVRSIILAGNIGEDIEIISSQERTNTIYFRVKGEYGEWSPGLIISDLFATDITPHGLEDGVSGLWYEDREGLGNVSGEGLRIRINKNRLSSLDVAGIKQWLSTNNVTVYYMDRDTPTIINTPFISNRTYEPSTTLVVNTPGATQPDVCTFEVNVNLANVIERLYDSISDIRKGNYNSEMLYEDTDVNELRGYGKINHGRKLKNASVSTWCTIITIFYNNHNHGYQICIPWDANINISERRFNGSWTAWGSVHDKTSYLNNVCSQLQVQINDLHSRIDSAVASYKFTDSSGNCQNLGSVDWNTVKRSGYFMGSGTTNAPENSGDWFMVKVMAHNSIWCEQIATAFATTQKRYIRYQTNGSWTAWRSL